MTDNRLAGADFVRALACLMVLAHHVAQRVSPRFLEPGQIQVAMFVTMGALGVCAFFVLSGYLLSRPFWVAIDANERMPSLRTYALRRSARILPGFWLALTVAFLMSFTILKFPFSGELVLRYLSGVFGVSAFHWLTWFPVEFDQPLWSIGAEIFSYVVLGLALWLVFKLPFRGWGARVVWLVVIAAVLGGQYLLQTYGVPDSVGRGWEHGSVGGAKFWWPNYNPIAFFAMFAVGVLAASLQVRVAKYRNIVFDLIALGGLGFAAWQLYAYGPDSSAYGLLNIPYAYPWFPIGVGIVLLAMPSSVFLRWISENPVVAYIARVSFGVYVWHYFLMEVVRTLWVPQYVYWGMRDVGQWAWISAGVVGSAFVIATLSYYLLEEPVIRWARTLERRSMPDAPTLSPAAG
jgi:peptidoglycan/LPS O-acetylase OafA/YrhL